MVIMALPLKLCELQQFPLAVFLYYRVVVHRGLNWSTSKEIRKCLVHGECSDSFLCSSSRSLSSENYISQFQIMYTTLHELIR